MEIWKDIEGYEGLYQASNKGNIRSLNYRRKGISKLLKLREVTKGYLQVVLWKNKKSKCFQVHRLVAEAFIPNPDNLPQVNHKDENKENNKIENLEWCTNEYNHNYGTRNLRGCDGLKKYNIEKSKRVYQYTLDGKLVSVYSSATECNRSGYNQGCVSACCNGKIKTHKGYKWEYGQDYEALKKEYENNQLNSFDI